MFFVENQYQTSQVRLNFAESSPTGPPLVLVHGLPGHWQEFLPIFPDLGATYQIFAVDLRGQGMSGRPGKYHSSDYAPDIIEFIQGYVGQPVVVWGMSTGGFIGLDAASQAPKLVKALVVGDPPIDLENLIAWMSSDGFKHRFSAFREIAGLDAPPDETAEKVAQIPIPVPGQDEPILYGDQPGIDERRLKELGEVLSKLDPDVLAYHAEGRVEEYLGWIDLSEVYAKITCPVLLLQPNPELGGMVTDRAAAFAMSKLKDGRHVFMEEYGHNLGLDSGEVGALLLVVKGFLKEVDSR
jgi:pimeloyl-ACP methyl ester carboxylesterase